MKAIINFQKLFSEFTYNTAIFFLSIKIWVFGMIERDSNKVILYLVEKRDEATLLPLILKHVEPGSCTFTDGWGSYNHLNHINWL